ncbi:hypothetical protein [Hydrogenophaga sp.]|uniref:hypothetical protein n=1 Tax=Hydrogenophaga sp. TaxID=1904254 RepID=UPI003F6EA857
MWIFVLWSLAALLSALGIVIDMRRLGVSRDGVSTRIWTGASIVFGPLAVGVYLFKRPAMRRQLIGAVWRLVGDASHPASVRLARLEALNRMGIVGPTIFRSCLRELRQGLVINRSKEERSK